MDGASYPQTTHAATDAFHLTDAKCKGMKKPFRVCPRRSLFRHHSPSCSPFYRPLLAPHSDSPGAILKLPWRSPQTTQALSLYPTCPNALPHVSRGLAPRGPTVLPHLTQRRCPTCPTALPHLPKQIWPRAPKAWRQGSLGIAPREFGHSVKGVPDKGQSNG